MLQIPAQARRALESLSSADFRRHWTILSDLSYKKVAAVATEKPREIMHANWVTWTTLVEMIVPHPKRLYENLDIGHAVRVLVAFAATVCWILAMYAALSP